MLQRSPRRDRNRWQRYRQRQRDGLLVPAMEAIGPAEVQFLVDTRWLAEADTTDRRKVGAAIAAMLRGSAWR